MKSCLTGRTADTTRSAAELEGGSGPYGSAYSSPEVVAATLQAIGTNGETTGGGVDRASMIESSQDTFGGHDEYGAISSKKI
jgi:hypothetical protein